MAFPERVTVRLSSDEAGGITLTPVVAKQMRPAELIDLMLPLTGKDAARLRELLARGNWVEGGSRFRWAGFEVSEP